MVVEDQQVKSWCTKEWLDEIVHDETTTVPGQTRVTVDCQKCGACCFGPQGWIDVDEALDDTPRKLCKDFFGPNRGYRMGAMAMVEGRCIALEMQPEGTWKCSIYKKRPTSCREFEPGSDGCLEARDKRREAGATIL